MRHILEKIHLLQGRRDIFLKEKYFRSTIFNIVSMWSVDKVRGCCKHRHSWVTWHLKERIISYIAVAFFMFCFIKKSPGDLRLLWEQGITGSRNQRGKILRKNFHRLQIPICYHGVWIYMPHSMGKSCIQSYGPDFGTYGLCASAFFKQGRLI